MLNMLQTHVTNLVHICEFPAGTALAQKQLTINMSEKMTDTEFLGDITAYIRPHAFGRASSGAS
jgi:hypothetical protein